MVVSIKEGEAEQNVFSTASLSAINFEIRGGGASLIIELITL